MNNPALVIDLIYGKKYMTIMRDDDITMSERKLKFSSVDMENLSCDILFLSGKKPKITIPLDFDEIQGLDGVLLLISAFVYPDSNLSFQIYSAQTDSLEHIYFVKNPNDGTPKIVSCTR